jgi:release factor glutamine methyltransferase
MKPGRSIVDHVSRAAGELANAGIGPGRAAFDAEVLARHALGWDRARYLAERRGDPPAGFAVRFDTLIGRRQRFEPVAYIVGMREFWSLDFAVTPDVLIPRPESELIVEEALAIAGDGTPRTVIDVGTGSGCLAVALAREWPQARLIATDMSSGALAVARGNARRHGVAARVGLVQTDLLEGLALEADLIVSNPPYVASADAPALHPEVRDHEPAIALYGGPDGLGVVSRLASRAGRCLRSGGHLICEFGLGQEAEALDRFERDGWTIERVRSDLQGIARVLVARRTP